jgi:hypothetical protein
MRIGVLVCACALTASAKTDSAATIAANIAGTPLHGEFIVIPPLSITPDALSPPTQEAQRAQRTRKRKRMSQRV